METKFFVLNEERNVNLTAYLQPVGGEFRSILQRPAVLILPGGGYHFCSDREADPVAFPYLKAGYHAFILRYSLGDQAVWPNPLRDYEQAMSMIREHSEDWHIEPQRIAVIGFSAGGHLAACAATMSKNRPNAAILGYPVITGETVHDYLPSAPDAAKAVDSKTCPCFVFATRTDNLVPVENSLHFLTALEKHDIAFESHIYSNGPHGLSTGDESLDATGSCCRYSAWVADSISWLNDVLGGFSDQGLTDPRFGAAINGNRDKTLNLDCTIQYLLANPEACALLSFLSQTQDGDTPFPSAAKKVITLRECLSFAGIGEEELQAIETRLKAIKNS